MSDSGGMQLVIVRDNTEAIIRAMHKTVAKVVADTAEVVTSLYVANAARDTGFMASSAYTVTHADSSYGQGLVGDGPTLPEVDKPANDLTAYSAVAAVYAAYVELGTSKMAAQPAFIPAVDVATKQFGDKLDSLESLIRPQVEGS